MRRGFHILDGVLEQSYPITRLCIVKIICLRWHNYYFWVPGWNTFLLIFNFRIENFCKKFIFWNLWKILLSKIICIWRCQINFLFVIQLLLHLLEVLLAHFCTNCSSEFICPTMKATWRIHQSFLKKWWLRALSRASFRFKQKGYLPLSTNISLAFYLVRTATTIFDLKFMTLSFLELYVCCILFAYIDGYCSQINLFLNVLIWGCSYVFLIRSQFISQLD